MSITQILIAASLLTLVTTAVVEVIKQALDVPGKYVPLVALVTGIILGLATAVIVPGYTVGALAWVGGLSGLASAGLFDFSKANKTLEEAKLK